VCLALSPAAATGALGRFGLVGRSELTFAGVAGLTAAGECPLLCFSSLSHDPPSDVARISKKFNGRPSGSELYSLFDVDAQMLNVTPYIILSDH